MASARDDEYTYQIALAAYNARRAHAAYMLRMISAYVLYKDSEKPPLRRAYYIARKWLFSHDNRKYMSFENVCEALDWPPDATRERIKTLSREDLVRGTKLVGELGQKKDDESNDDTGEDS